MLSIVVTIIKWRILTYLINNQVSLSEIARKTNTTKANTFHSLKELEKLDIVRKIIQGRTHIYRFNFLHPKAEYILEMITEEKRVNYNKKLDNLPSILNTFLSNLLKTNYKGCIFFGSSIEQEYNDIDVFIILKNKKNIKEIEKKIKLINKKLSPTFGSEKELEIGIKNQDMLYKNILEGIPFKQDIIKIKYKDLFLRKTDIKERFIIGYREVLSCLEFTDRKYQKNHLEKGVMDFIYAILNYFDLSPKNDKEAITMFNNKFKEPKPKTIKTALNLMRKYAWLL